MTKPLNFPTAALAAALVLSGLAGTADAKPAAHAKAGVKAVKAAAAGKRWDQTVTLNESGFPVIGNPAAPVKVTEFISMTCPHCADFSKESEAGLMNGLVRQGKVSLEMRPFIRTPVDPVPALLVMCGDKSRYYANQAALLAAQDTWFKPPKDPGYQARWQALDSNPAAQRKVVAQDLGLYAMMQARGYTPAQLDACLADDQKLAWLNAETDKAVNVTGVQGTPSFLINGSLQSVYGWPPLQPLIARELAKPPVAVAAAKPAPAAQPEVPASRIPPAAQ